MEIEVGGITYESIIVQFYSCRGCVADVADEFLCRDIHQECGRCIGKDGSSIIWVEKGNK